MEKLAKNINAYHLVVRSIGSVIVYVGFIVLAILPSHLFGELFVKVTILIATGIIVLLLAVFNFILPFYIYRFNGYQINNDHVIVQRGVLFRRNIVIPIKRIQHIEKFQGPLQMLFRITTVLIFTAGSNVLIIGIPVDRVDAVIESIRQPLQHYLDSDEVIHDES